ncbi:MAG: urea ABC transporter permease subunit UrtB [Rhodospirillales bacterium 69-11]|nr:MAG: urea ABC transporter permease subunit UrtB [Rhodospirillales bacterium 69-11]
MLGRSAWLMLVLLLLAPLHARAQGVDEAYAALSGSAGVPSAAGFESVRRGVEQLATSGDPRAAVVIGALQAGQLYARPDRTLFIKQPDGSYVDARTGAPAPDAAGLKQVRLNNAVRSAIDAALGSLRLFAPDAATRLAAAEAVFKSHDPAALPALNQALAKESDAAVKTRMQQARAAALLSSPDASEADRLAAVATLRARGDIDARGFLASLSGQPPAVANAAGAAITAIDRQLQLWSILQSVYYGISLGSVLLLAAAGLAITFGVMGVINMAHGEMVMIGAYTTFVVQQLMRAYLPGVYAINLLLAVPLAFLVAGAIGVLIERTLIRWLYGRPLETLLATWGLSLILQQAVRSIFGANNRDVDTPWWMSGATQLGGLTLTWNRMYIVLFAVLVLAALMAALRYTPLGLRMRAVTQNRRMAAAMGIRTPWIDALTFGLGSGVAGMAGVALSQIDNVSPNLGQGYIIDSFMVVVFGGVGNLWGTTLGALTLGIVNKFLEPVAGAVLGKIVVLVLLILFIQRRPRGMFPLKGRAVET